MSTGKHLTGRPAPASSSVAANDMSMQALLRIRLARDSGLPHHEGLGKGQTQVGPSSWRTLPWHAHSAHLTLAAVSYARHGMIQERKGKHIPGNALRAEGAPRAEAAKQSHAHRGAQVPSLAHFVVTCSRA